MIKQIIWDHHETLKKQNSWVCSLHGKIGIKINNTVFTSKEKINKSLLKKPSASKESPHLMLIIWTFIALFLIEYNLIGIVKLKFTRRNKILLRILEDLTKKCAQNAGSNVLKLFFLERNKAPKVNITRTLLKKHLILRSWENKSAFLCTNTSPLDPELPC